MLQLVRVDDRLLHGQVLCAWAPFVKADCVVIASDEAASDSLFRDVITSCAGCGLGVAVRTIKDAVRDLTGGVFKESRVILIVGGLRDAMRLYEGGIRFTSLNIGNMHHENGGRRIAPSVTLTSEDAEIMDAFDSLGVALDIRDLPMSEPVIYESWK